MKYVTGLLLVGLAISPALAQKAAEQKPKEPKFIQLMKPGVTYEDCAARCEKCEGGDNPDCVREFCSGYPHRGSDAIACRLPTAGLRTP